MSKNPNQPEFWPGCAGAFGNLDYHSPNGGAINEIKVKSCLFVRVATTDGIYDWGEACVMPNYGKAVAEKIHALNRSASKLKFISPWALSDLALQAAAHHQSLELNAASNALERAL